MSSIALGVQDRQTKLVAQVAFAILFFSAWELYGRLGNPQIVPPVTWVLAAFADLVLTGRLITALIPSLKLLVLGFSAAVICGLVLGILIGRSRTADLTLGPYLAALYATPDIALVPLILVWFGFDLPGRVVVVFLSAIFSMLYNVAVGVRAVPSSLIDVARSFSASRMQVLFQVVVPSAMPFIIAGLRLSIGRAVVGMAVAEVYLRLGGIGELIAAYGARFDTDSLIASILILPLMGIGLSRLVGLLERRVTPWKTV